MRISGLVLVLLALGHLAIMHVINSVDTVNYEFVANRWTDPSFGYFWRIWDLLMVSLAVLHGFNGLRQVLYEYVARPGWRVFCSTAIWTIAVFLLVVGSYAILMFVPDAQYIARAQGAREGVTFQMNDGRAPAAPTQ
jgi:succinate dehydrogenase / fumarate reductase membrane anchor subunit